MNFLSAKIYAFNCAEMDETALKPFVTQDEFEKSQRYHFLKDRLSYLCARAEVRKILADSLAIDPLTIEFGKNAYGKPLIKTEQNPNGIHFNVSHTKDIVLIAVDAERAVGIDVEWLDRDVECLSLAERFFAPQEFAQLKNLPENLQQQGFFKAWVCKEAVLKAQGKGLSGGLDQVIVDVDPRVNATVLREENWQLNIFTPAVNYLAAAAVLIS